MASFSAIAPYNFANYGLLGQGLPRLYAPPLSKWIAVRQRFEQFHRDLLLTPLQLRDGNTKRAGVVGCLNRHYYGSASDTDNSFMTPPDMVRLLLPRYPTEGAIGSGRNRR